MDDSSNEEQLDQVSQAIIKTGCLELHNAVQECMFEHKDWRVCQKEVQSFRNCIQDYNSNQDKRSRHNKMDGKSST